uniref:Origin recognition complex subunit 5 C-terminal domain-containing protein n=1 Tax=Percolomonas cosmopolitus TaxID=63605 RepID=A0A7S1PGQ1_9EUKA|mmetsp:Transcript_6512/g.24463  ORF Transcript_6512/g.24463 Transcript_6512/m.24463 type:complete len:619 (+) Transcript_6512:605-2461(+)
MPPSAHCSPSIHTSLRPHQSHTLQSCLLASPFPYSCILLHGEASSGKSHYLHECLFGAKQGGGGGSVGSSSSGSDQRDQNHHHTHSKRRQGSTTTRVPTFVSEQSLSAHIGDTIYMRNRKEMQRYGHVIDDDFREEFEEMTLDGERMEPTTRPHSNTTHASPVSSAAQQHSSATQIVEPSRLIITIDSHELPHSSQALLALLSKKLHLSCPQSYDLAKMLHADERFARNGEENIFKRRRRAGALLQASYFLQEMERINESFHTPDLIVLMTNATEFLCNVPRDHFHHWMSIFESMYQIFNGRVCLVMEAHQPKEHVMRDVFMERDVLAVYFPRYSIEELKSILKAKNPQFAVEVQFYEEFLSLFLGAMHGVNREIGQLQRMVLEVYPVYRTIATQNARIKFLQDLLKIRLKHIKNPKLVYLEKAHTVSLFDEQDKNIEVGSDEWMDESSNKLSHRQIEQTHIQPYIINKDMTLLHALVLIATYVAKVQPKELDANMYVTEEEGVGKRRRKRVDSGGIKGRDASKPIPLSRINQIFYHILEDSDQDGLKMIRKQRWLTHDIHEAVRHLCSLGMMRDANSYSTLSDKKTFFLVVDQSFVELIAAPFGVSLTTYGIRRKDI